MATGFSLCSFFSEKQAGHRSLCRGEQRVDEFRAAHENYGCIALAEGRPVRCSEPTVTHAVIELARARLTDCHKILDVGCGANLDYDIFLADMGKRPVCVDFAMSLLRLAPKDPRMCLVQAEATLLPFADSSFDSVICSETIEHIPRDDVVIAEIARVLRPGGVFVITVPNLWNASRLLQMLKRRDLTVHLMPGHLREYTPGRLHSLLAPYFTVEQWSPVTFGWTGKVGGPLDWLVRIGLLKRLSKSVACVARKMAPMQALSTPIDLRRRCQAQTTRQWVSRTKVRILPERS